jgi:hypothetical protein
MSLWHACPKWHAERFPWHAAFTAVPVFVCLLPDQRLYIVYTMCVHTHTHMSDCIQTVYEWPSLPNNTALKQFYTNQSVDWIFIVGASAWRWLAEYVTLDRTFYRLLLQQQAVSAQLLTHFVPYRIPRRGFYQKYDIIIILWINYNIH